MRSFHRAADELARDDAAKAAPWVGFFGPTDLEAVSGMTHLELSTTDAGHLDSAIEAVGRAVAARNTDQARSRTFEITALAVATPPCAPTTATPMLGGLTRDALGISVDEFLARLDRGEYDDDENETVLRLVMLAPFAR